MQTVYIYAIQREETGDAYIGSTIHARDRWVGHQNALARGKHSSRHLQRAWNKYGKEAFHYWIIEKQECADRKERIALELRWIAKMGTYNVMLPSEDICNFTVSEETRKMRSVAAKLKAKEDPEYAAFLKNRGTEVAAFMKSEEGRELMSGHMKRVWKKPEQREKRLAGIKRMWADPEQKASVVKSMIAMQNSPERLAINREKSLNNWQQPEYREKVVEKAAKNRWGDPEKKKIQAEKMRAYHAKRRAGLLSSTHAE